MKEDNMYEEAQSILVKHNQAQVLKIYEKMTEENREKLLKQIERINFEQIESLYQKTKEEVLIEKDKIEPIKVYDKDTIVDGDKKKYTEIGEDIIRNGKFSVVTMAGGQGTRLGHAGPKGTFMLGTEPNKSIFQILCENLKAAKEKYGVFVPWYIMTSKENNDKTISFFEENDYFGYDKSMIKFFEQGELPMLSFEGKVIQDKDGLIKEGADGNGGIFEALSNSKVLEDMEQKGIKWICVSGVDNVLANMVDPTYIGITQYNKKQIASKSTIKTSPEEKVGVFCKRNGTPGIIEYIEITTEMAQMKDYNNEYVYGDCNIISHLFSIESLNIIKEKKLPWHIAKKKAEYLDEDGKMITPEEPNIYKFETFIFDAFDFFDDMLVYRVKREEEFAPVKNAEGVDSPETARKLYNEFHNKF